MAATALCEAEVPVSSRIFPTPCLEPGEAVNTPEPSEVNLVRSILPPFALVRVIGDVPLTTAAVISEPAFVKAY